MLFITTKQGQEINVGDSTTVSVILIDFEKLKVRVCIKTPEAKREVLLSPGGITQCIDNVLFFAKFIDKNNGSVALGFKAPKEIKIRGNWMRPTRRQLSDMSDKELIHAGTLPSSRGLENELAKRLKEKLNDD